jgi:hypothetical protein
MRRSRRRRVVIEEKPVVEDLVRSLTGSSPDEGSTPDENVLKEMESITTRLDQGLNMGNWNIFDAIAGIEMSALTKPKVAIAPPTLSPQTLPPTEVVPKPTTPITPLRSALKGNRPASSPSPEAKTKPHSSFSELQQSSLPPRHSSNNHTTNIPSPSSHADKRSIAHRQNTNVPHGQAPTASRSWKPAGIS